MDLSETRNDDFELRVRQLDYQVFGEDLSSWEREGGGDACIEDGARRYVSWGLTFELTARAEAGGVSPDCDDSTTGAGRAYDACRSESGVERGVRPHY